MSDLLASWAEVEPRLRAASRLCILCDFDGTLAPIVDRPEEAVLPKATRETLESLAGASRAVVGVVSGRALDDLLPRLGLEGIWVVGNHGCEIRSPRGEIRRTYDEADLARMAAVAGELERATATVPGVGLERKGPIVAVHYRRVDRARRIEVERAFLGVIERHRRELMMSRGHCVLEARLRGIGDKGVAVRQICRTLPIGSLTIYFGDDVTDRDAFREVRHGGLSVEVGVEETVLADHTLKDPAAVAEALRRLEALVHPATGYADL